MALMALRFPTASKVAFSILWSGILFLKRELIMEQVVDTPENNILIMS